MAPTLTNATLHGNDLLKKKDDSLHKRCRAQIKKDGTPPRTHPPGIKGHFHCKFREEQDYECHEKCFCSDFVAEGITRIEWPCIPSPAQRSINNTIQTAAATVGSSDALPTVVERSDDNSVSKRGDKMHKRCRKHLKKTGRPPHIRRPGQCLSHLFLDGNCRETCFCSDYEAAGLNPQYDDCIDDIARPSGNSTSSTLSTVVERTDEKSVWWQAIPNVTQRDLDSIATVFSVPATIAENGTLHYDSPPPMDSFTALTSGLGMVTIMWVCMAGLMFSFFLIGRIIGCIPRQRHAEVAEANGAPSTQVEEAKEDSV